MKPDNLAVSAPLALPEKGRYIFVKHSFTNAEIGVEGVFVKE